MMEIIKSLIFVIGKVIKSLLKKLNCFSNHCAKKIFLKEEKYRI